MQVLSGWAGGLEISRSLVFEHGFVRRSEIGRASEEPRHVLRDDVEDRAGGITPADALCVGGKDRQFAIPFGVKLASVHLADLVARSGYFVRYVSREAVPQPV